MIHAESVGVHAKTQSWPTIRVFWEFGVFYENSGDILSCSSRVLPLALVCASVLGVRGGPDLQRGIVVCTDKRPINISGD